MLESRLEINQVSIDSSRVGRLQLKSKMQYHSTAILLFLDFEESGSQALFFSGFFESFSAFKEALPEAS